MPGFLRTEPAARQAGPAAAWEQIFDQATADGWHALYDLTNPNTRTLREDTGTFFVEAIQDALGNFPDLAQATAVKQPTYSEGAFGELDASVFGGDNSGHVLKAGAVSRTQPFFFMLIAKLDNVTAELDYLIDARIGADFDGAFWGIANVTKNVRLRFSTSELTGSTNIGTNAHIYDVLVNGVSSQTMLNGAVDISGDVGTNDMQSLAVGFRDDEGSPREWNGPVGPLLFFDGNPSGTVRDNMRNLLSELSGIAVA